MRVYCKVCGHSWVATLVVRPHLKPLGQDHKPTGAQFDGLAHTRGEAVGSERTGSAIASPDLITDLLETVIHSSSELIVT